MKKVFIPLLCFCMIITNFEHILVHAQEGSLLSGSVIWASGSYISDAGELHNLVDGHTNTALSSKELGALTKMRLFFDIAPDGGEISPYNKLKVKFNSYNVGKIAMYTSNDVYNMIGKVTAPPTANTTSNVGFKDYNMAVGQLDLTPAYITLPGGENYPEALVLSFAERRDRFICVELTVAVDSTSGEYTGIHNAISEIELYQGVPFTVKVSSEAEKVSVPSEIGKEKTVRFAATVLDADNDPITDPAMADCEFSLGDLYKGISINAEGVLTITKEAIPGTVTVIAKCTADGYETVLGKKKIELTDVDAVEKEVAEAAARLEFSMISQQNISSVGKDLSLLCAENGKLTIGDKTYYDMEISWSSSNEAVISNNGDVVRPSDANAAVTLTAVISKKNLTGDMISAEKTFVITVVKAGEPVDMVNVMLGGYGWVTAGWGTASSAVDGDKANAWRLGNHSQGTIGAGFRTASGKAEKYNKVIVTLATRMSEKDAKMVDCTITGYDTANDPGPDGSLATGFQPGLGAVPILTYVVSPDDPDKLELAVDMPESAQSTYFGIRVTNGAKDVYSSNGCGVYEFEVYYATPYDAELADGDTVFYIPTRQGTASFDIPQFTVYDEMGNVLKAAFEYDISLAKDIKGITLQDGKINVEYGCTADSVELLYRSWDEDKIWLEKVIAIPLCKYTQEYYDAEEAGAYLAELIPGKLDADITLPTEYNGAAISWSSNKDEYLSATGKVQQPSFEAQDEEVVLTAVITKGPYTITRRFGVTVIKNMTDAQRVLQDANKIVLDITDTVRANIDLPLKGYYGSDITWRSSNPNVISNSGKYSRITASERSIKVTLTATLAFQDAVESKDFLVYAEAIKNGTGGASGGNGGIGGGSASISGNMPVYPAGEEKPLEPLTQEEIAMGKFSDVPIGHWAKEYIETLAERQIVSGVDATHFEPERSVTREEFIKMIVTAFGVTLKPGKTDFSDVESGAWYEDYVVTAYREELINGFTASAFGIGLEITREDMVVIMDRILTRYSVKYAGEIKTFADQELISDYAVSAVKNLSMVGVLNGDETDKFLPKKSATRAEAAKVLLLAMEKGGIQ